MLCICFSLYVFMLFNLLNVVQKINIKGKFNLLIQHTNFVNLKMLSV